MADRLPREPTDARSLFKETERCLQGEHVGEDFLLWLLRRPAKNICVEAVHGYLRFHPDPRRTHFPCFNISSSMYTPTGWQD